MWEWVIPKKKKAEYSTSAQSADSDDKRPDTEKRERASPKRPRQRATQQRREQAPTTAVQSFQGTLWCMKAVP